TLRGLRRRSPPPQPGGVLRPVARLLRRLLPAGAARAAHDRRRLPPRPGAGLRLDHGAGHARRGPPLRRQPPGPDRRLAGRHLHTGRQPVGPARHVHPLRLRRRIGPDAHRAAAHRPVLRRRPSAGPGRPLPASHRLAPTHSGTRIMDWEIVIGLETHTQLSTRSKIFSRSSTRFGAEPNTQANAVDMALPGSLPAMNRGAVERAIQFGLAVGARVAERSVFARKNYFYPDLPKNYQISQFELPIVVGGKLSFFVGEQEHTVNLTRAHLEEDAGKSLHEHFTGPHGESSSGIDLNRAGTPLLEI